MRYILPPLAILIAAAITFALIQNKEKALPLSPDIQIPSVQVIKAESEPIVLKVNTQGTVQAQTESTLSAEVSGRIVSVSNSFKIGGFFQTNETILQIDKSDYISLVATANAELARSELKLAQELAMVDQAVKDWEKMGQGSPSDLTLRKPQLAEARASVTAAKEAVKRAELNLKRTTIKAPYACLIREKFVDLAQTVSSTPATPIARIYAIDFAEVRLPVSSREHSLLKLPPVFKKPQPNIKYPKVILKANDSGMTTTWEGIINRTEGIIDSQSRLSYLVAQIPDPYRLEHAEKYIPLRLGQFVEATIFGKTIQNAFLIPRSAIRSNNEILVVSPDNTMQRRNVTIVQKNAETAIVSEGLSNGEFVCISPIEIVVDGMNVKPEIISESTNQ